MCFSATASFTTAAILIPTGIYCLNEANQLEKPYWAFAMFPFIFGLQQLLEGGVWLALLKGDAMTARAFALGFLLFSHVFWVGWVPYSSYLTESSARFKRVFKIFTIIGVLFGASMFVPLLFIPEWLTASIVNDSIHYKLMFFSGAYVSQPMLTAVYAILILLPLMLSSDRYHNILGVLTLFSGLLAWISFNWVFVSVWCYFAAVISLYIFYIIARCVNTTRVPNVA